MRWIITLIGSFFLCMSAFSQWQEPIRLDAGGIDSTRQHLQDVVFGDKTIPPLVMDKTGEPVNTMAMALGPMVIHYPSQNIRSVETGTITLDHNFISKVFFFHPMVSNGLNTRIIYHAGHVYGVANEDNYINDTHMDEYSVRVIDYFLSHGFEVVALNMPLVADNTAPEQILEGTRVYPMMGHHDIFYLKDPFYYFVAPMKATTDYLQAQFNCNEFIMVGLSGGGWTTTLYSALDPRIVQSYPVAGSIPIPLRTAPNDWGDEEQNDSTFYSEFNYTTLYFLGSSGKNRLQYQVLNMHDDCCFAFNGASYWVPAVQHALQQSTEGGALQFLYDTFSLTHHISLVAVDSIAYHVNQDFVARLISDSNRVRSSRGNNTLCDHDSMRITIPNAENNVVAWFRDGVLVKDSATTSLQISSPGTYWARLQNMCGAVAYTDSVMVTQSLQLIKPVIRPHNGVLSSSYDKGNQWYLDDQPLPGATSQTLVSHNAGVYTVRVTLGSCTSDFSDPYQHGVFIAPNPVLNNLIVRMPRNAKLVNYRLCDLEGRVFAKGQFIGELNLPIGNRMKAGIYVLELETMNGYKTTSKVVISR